LTILEKSQLEEEGPDERRDAIEYPLSREVIRKTGELGTDKSANGPDPIPVDEGARDHERKIL